MKRVYLDGYLRLNFGDDLFFKIICERYPDVEFYSYSEVDYSCLENEVGNLFVSNRSPFIPDKLAHAMTLLGKSRTVNCFVKLGGSVFIQPKKKNAIRQSLSDELYKRYVGAVTKSYNHVFVLGANYGPTFNCKYDESNLRLFEASDDVCFREKASQKLFSNLSQVRYAPDIVFSYQAKHRKKMHQAFVSLVDVYNECKFSFDREACCEYERYILDWCKLLSREGYQLVISGFCRHENDFEAVKRLVEKLEESNIPYKVMNYMGSLEKVITEISSSEILIGSRFHSIVLGFICSCKVLPVVYSSKTCNMLDMVGFPKETRYVIGSNNAEQHMLLKAVCDSDVLDISSFRHEAQNQFCYLDRYLDNNE